MRHLAALKMGSRFGGNDDVVGAGLCIAHFVIPAKAGMHLEPDGRVVPAMTAER
jgi:hypothetical protein